jgi:hypothetical protein
MNRLLIGFCFCMLLACKSGRKLPDISGIRVPLQVLRYEQDFFSIDTNQLNTSLFALSKKYGGFHADFIYNILGTSKTDEAINIRSFIQSYQPLYADANRLSGINNVAETVQTGFTYLHYYFPNYKLPTKFITFIGPINSYASIITTDAVAVGLQLFLGANHPLYKTEQTQALYPAFISRKFDPDYIPVSVLNTVIDDLYPNKSLGESLIVQMVEAGKRLYLLDAVLPSVADTLKIGYTAVQLQDAFSNQRNIWSYFVQADILYKGDPELTRDFMNEGPYTAALGPNSPGRIGLFVGWQIVKKWMDKNSSTTLQGLMEKDPAKLFEESKYKP